MRTNVTFRHTAKFVPLSDEDGIIAVNGAQWFAALLRRVQALEIDENLCQEDWGRRVICPTQWTKVLDWTKCVERKRHMARPLSPWFTGVVAAVRFVWQERIEAFVGRCSPALAGDAAISDIAWYEESEMHKPQPRVSQRQ